jgi:hypothetical protein
MTRTEELLALAEAATSPYADDWELKQALLKFDRAANPETIRQLVELVRLQNAALFETTALCTNYEAVEEDDGYQFTEAPAVIEQGNEALAAFNKWENGK